MSWQKYLDKTSQKEPSLLLIKAIDLLEEKGRALDLGSGAMNDSKYLLAQGFSVDAVDSDPEVRKYSPPEVNLYISDFAAFTYPKDEYNIINAQYSLPFNPPDNFNEVFQRIISSLKSGGIFVGQFFGPEDSWADTETMTFHTQNSLNALLKDLEVVSLKEVKKGGTTALGKEKFWHVFHVIARKP